MKHKEISQFMEFGSWPQLVITGSSKERLIAAMQFLEHNNASGYYLDEKQMIYFWTDQEKATRFPVKMSLETCAHMAFEWLSETAKYPQEPDHDGDNRRGWKISIDSWGSVEGFGWESFVKIEPFWIMFGK